MNKIEYSKENMQGIYKKYKCDISKNETVLIEATEIFNIPIDRTRMEDYSILNFDINIPSIRINDKKNNTIYTSTYIDNDTHNVNCVLAESPTRKVENFYYTGSKNPIKSTATFFNGEYDLVFEREMFNNDCQMTVSLAKNMEYEGQNIKQQLFNKIYRNVYNNKKKTGIFEQEYTYMPEYLMQWDDFEDTQDRYTYMNNDNVIYKTFDLNKKDYCICKYGICFENTKMPIDNFIANKLAGTIKSFPLINQKDIMSAMMINVRTQDGIYHTLQVYKDIEALHVEYNTKKHYFGEQYHEETINNVEYSLQNLNNETISSEEIRVILSSLQTKINDPKVLSVILNELNNFSTKIDVKKGNIQGETDKLSPKLFIEKSFEDICALVDANRDDYFKLIQEQYNIMANINAENDQTRTLKK